MGSRLLVLRSRSGSHQRPAGLGLAMLVAVSFLGAQENAQKEQDPQPTRDVVRPPPAIYCQPDECPDANRVVLDVTQDGRVVYLGKVVASLGGAGRGPADVRAALLALKARPTTNTEVARIGPQVIELVDDPILIRADRHTEWHCVGEVMRQCSQPAVAFWKIQLGVTEQDEETAAFKPAYLPRDLGRTAAAPVERLVVKIVCKEWGKSTPRKPADGEQRAGAEAFELEGHEVTWEVGPVRVASESDLRVQLQRARDRLVDDPDRPDRKKPMPVVVEPQAGVTYGDVIRTLDALMEARFEEFAFGAGGAPRRK